MSQYWNQEPIVFNNKKVYQRDDLVNPYFTHSKSTRSNLERMKAGLAPLGKDGKPINLHHVNQNNKGAIVEIEASMHSKNSSVIHVNSGSRLPSGIDRSQFKIWRNKYWINRAKEIEQNAK